jgi:hypothetical protein
MRELALEHVGGGISDDTYLARLKQFRISLAEIEETAQVGVPAERAVAWLRALGETWNQADVPEARSDLLHAIYERIVVAGRDFVSARLTPAAYANGLALALPEQVVRARPTGVGPALATRIPIEGRAEWAAAAGERSVRETGTCAAHSHGQRPRARWMSWPPTSKLADRSPAPLRS